MAEDNGNELALKLKAQKVEEAKVKALVERKAKAVKECCAHWNAFVLSVLGAKKLWEIYKEDRIREGLAISDFPLDAQKILYLANPHGEFDFLIEDLVTHRDLENYLNGLIINFK